VCVCVTYWVKYSHHSQCIANTEKMLRAQVISQQKTQTVDIKTVTMSHTEKI